MQPARRAGGQTRQNGRAGSGETRCVHGSQARAPMARSVRSSDHSTNEILSNLPSLNDPVRTVTRSLFLLKNTAPRQEDTIPSRRLGPPAVVER